MAEYKIISVKPLLDISPDGRFIKVYRITFEWKGMQDYVDVPESEYTEENVKKKIEEKIKVHSALLK